MKTVMEVVAELENLRHQKQVYDDVELFLSQFIGDDWRDAAKKIVGPAGDVPIAVIHGTIREIATKLRGPIEERIKEIEETTVPEGKNGNGPENKKPQRAPIRRVGHENKNKRDGSED